MPLRYLWKGSPCRRPVRASVSCRSWTGRLAVRHAGMPLRWLWEGGAVPKTGQKNALPREDATEVPVDRVAVPKGAHSTVHRPVRHRFGAGLPRGDGSEAPIGWDAVPKGALAELIKLRCVRFGTPNCWILRFVLLSLIDWRSTFGLTGCYAVLLDRVLCYIA